MVGLGRFMIGLGQFRSVWFSLGRFMVDLSQFGSVHGRFGPVCIGSWSGWVGSCSV